ncbi:MAG: hypothetical protein U0U66_12210 [Cytophagaceae bacterium]
MKKILLSTVSLLLLLSAKAQQLPNNNFEDWSAVTDCSTIDSVHGYTSVDVDMYNDVDICPSSNAETTIQKSTDAQSGSYAVKLQAVVFTPAPGFSYTVNPYLAVGTTYNQSEGIAFIGRPTKMKGYYKFINGGGDSLYFNSLTFNSNDFEATAYLEFHTVTSTSGSDYVAFEADFIYDPTKTNAPDSLMFYVGIINKDGFSGASPNSIAYIDNITLEYGTTTSTTKYKSVSPIQVYAADNKIVFSEEVEQVMVNNIVGAVQSQVNTTTLSVSTQGYKTGVYLVSYLYKNNPYSTKIVIE